MKLESLSRVFDGLPVKIHAHQADDIATAMRIGKEFGLKMTVDHCTEGYLIADSLKANDQMVILGPVMHNKSKYELKEKSFSSGKVLYEKGVTFSIMTDHPVIEQKHTMIHAALFVKAGLPELEALKAVLDNNTAAIMLTNPNTLGLFEEDILEISKLVHECLVHYPLHPSMLCRYITS